MIYATRYGRGIERTCHCRRAESGYMGAAFQKRWYCSTENSGKGCRFDQACMGRVLLLLGNEWGAIARVCMTHSFPLAERELDIAMQEKEAVRIRRYLAEHSGLLECYLSD